MKDHSEERVAKFWDRFLELVRREGVSQNAIPYYVKRVEEFIAVEKTRLRDRNGEKVSLFLEELGSRRGMEDWQVKQAAHALELLYRDLVPVAWARTYSWSKWRTSTAWKADEPNFEALSSRTPRDVDVDRPLKIIPGSTEKDRHLQPSSLRAHGAPAKRRARVIT